MEKGFRRVLNPTLSIHGRRLHTFRFATVFNWNHGPWPIEIVGLPIQDGDFTFCDVSLCQLEGKWFYYMPLSYDQPPTAPGCFRLHTVDRRSSSWRAPLAMPWVSPQSGSKHIDDVGWWKHIRKHSREGFIVVLEHGIFFSLSLEFYAILCNFLIFIGTNMIN
jgi:hypothetical protein